MLIKIYKSICETHNRIIVISNQSNNYNNNSGYYSFRSFSTDDYNNDNPIYFIYFKINNYGTKKVLEVFGDRNGYCRGIWHYS